MSDNTAEHAGQGIDKHRSFNLRKIALRIEHTARGSDPDQGPQRVQKAHEKQRQQDWQKI